jgi:prevent-host-death family protein
MYMKDEPVEMSVAEVRRYLADVINASSTRGRTTYIINRGRRVAAVVPLAVAEAAEETE